MCSSSGSGSLGVGVLRLRIFALASRYGSRSLTELCETHRILEVCEESPPYPPEVDHLLSGTLGRNQSVDLRPRKG